TGGCYEAFDLRLSARHRVFCDLAWHGRAGDGGYRLVPNWPKLPPGMYFGLRDAPPPPAEREAQAAARRARGGLSTGGQNAQNGGPANQPGISGLAIDAQDHIYVFNRGVKPVMVFD